MKPFWIVCLAAIGFLSIIGSCGPKHRYCPQEKDMECHVYDEAGAGNGGTGGTSSPCPDGGSLVLQGDALVCK